MDYKTAREVLAYKVLFCNQCKQQIQNCQGLRDEDAEFEKN